MDVKYREQADQAQVQELIMAQTHAVQRDRLRVALLACAGKQTMQMAPMRGRSRRFVQEWA